MGYELQFLSKRTGNWIRSELKPMEFDTLEEASVELVIRTLDDNYFKYRIFDTETQNPVNSQE